MDGIFFVLRTGTPWRDLPERYGPYTTCFNRYNRWSRNGLWEKIMSKLQELAEGDDNDGDGGGGELRLRMLDSSSIRVRRHGAGAPRDGEPPEVGLSRGGRTTKVRTGIDGNALAKAALPAPQWHFFKDSASFPQGLAPDPSRAAPAVSGSSGFRLRPCFFGSTCRPASSISVDTSVLAGAGCAP